MLLAFATLGAGMVSAEDCNEQTVDLEELGILELSMSEDGVVEALIVKEAFLICFIVPCSGATMEYSTKRIKGMQRSSFKSWA